MSLPDRLVASLIARRVALGLSTYQVSERIRAAHPALPGMQRVAIVRWERGGLQPSHVQLAAWAEALGLRLELVESEAVAAAADDELDPPTGARAARRRAA